MDMSKQAKYGPMHARLTVASAMLVGVAWLGTALPALPAVALAATDAFTPAPPFQLAEMTLSDFVEKFVDMAKGQDIEGIRRLIRENRQMAKETYKKLLQIAETKPEKDAKVYRTYAEVIATVLRQMGDDPTGSPPSPPPSSMTVKEFLQKFIELAKTKDMEGMRRLVRSNRTQARETAQALTELASSKSGEDAELYQNFARLITRILEGSGEEVGQSSPTPAPVPAGSADTLFQEGKALYEAKRYQEAVGKFQEAVRANPRMARAHYYLGLTYRRLDREDEAFAAFQEVSRLNPSDAYSHYYMGLILLKKNRYDDALEAMMKARDRKNDDSDIHYFLGVIYNRLKQSDKALASFQRAEEMNSKDPDIFINIGNIYLGRDKLDLALIYYRKAVGVKRDYANAYYNIGLILARRNNYPEAVEAYENYLKYAPDASDADEVRNKIQQLRRK